MAYLHRLASLTLLLGSACSSDIDDLFGGTGPGGTGPGGAGPGSGAGDVGGSSAGGASTGGAPGTGGTPGTGGAGSCGDGVIDQGEGCDGANLGGQSCSSLGLGDGQLACDQSCALDTSGCEVASECGNTAVEPGEECDDGNTEPFDGCSPDCKLQGATCASAIEVSLPAGSLAIDAATSGDGQLQPMGCGEGAAGPELFFRVTPELSGILTARLPADDLEFDSVLYAFADCGGAELTCHDTYATSNSNSGGELISIPVKGGVPIIVVVDAYEEMGGGEFRLELDLSSGETCMDVVPIVVDGAVLPTLYGDLTGYVGNTGPTATCLSIASGPDLVYQVSSIAGPGFFDATLDASFNGLLYVRTSCNSANQVDCDNPLSGDPTVSLNVGENSRFLWVDSETNTPGLFTVFLSEP